MTAVIHAQAQPLNVMTFGGRFLARFTRAYYQHKGRRVQPTSWQMQIFGHPWIIGTITRLGL